jgi:large conductance mechanosensitive channel
MHGQIIPSRVNDVIVPSIGPRFGLVSYSQLFVSLDGKSYVTLSAANLANAPTLNHGVFRNNILDFVTLVFAMFILLREFNRLPPAPTRVATASVNSRSSAPAQGLTALIARQ